MSEHLDQVTRRIGLEYTEIVTIIDEGVTDRKSGAAIVQALSQVGFIWRKLPDEEDHE